MTYVIGALVALVVIQAAVLVALMIRGRRRAEAERALRESEAKFRLIAERAPVIVWTARPDAMLDYVNSTCAEFTGLPMQELLNEGWLDIVHPDDRDRCIATYAPAFEARTPFLLEYRARRADGVYRWLLAHGVPQYHPDGSFAGYLGCDVDITERKDAEDRIRAGQAALEVSHREIQHLAGRLIESQDAERARLARDLHDDVSQQLAGLSIAFSGLRRRLGELQIGDRRASRSASAPRAHDHARAERPSALPRPASHRAATRRPRGRPDQLLCRGRAGARHGARCSAEGDFASIDPEVALCLYRIAQEALRNVIVHAGASRADVHLLRSRNDAELTIVDDGRGFDVASSPTRGKGLGLVSISERARLVSGTVRITSVPGEGTRVHVRIPTRMLVQSDEGSRSQDGQREYNLAPRCLEAPFSSPTTTRSSPKA